MKNNNLIRFVQSLVFLPIMVIGINQNVLVQKLNTATSGTLALNQAADPKVDLKAQTLQIEADAINSYFADHEMPLVGTGMKMAIEADNNAFDWRLLPAIAVRESTGGKNACDTVKHNPFGWGSCKIGFNSTEEAIAIVAKNLGGNNPSTALHYDNKTTKQILRAYNPPSIIPHYAEQVMAIMNAIGDANVTPNAPASSSDLSAQKA